MVGNIENTNFTLMVKTIKIIQVIGMALLSFVLILLWVLRVIGLLLTAGTESALNYIAVISNQIQENESKPDGNGLNG